MPAETPMFFPSQDHELFGVVTHPTGPLRDTGALLLWGAGGTASALGRNDLFVTLARRLATTGYHTLRFDYHGVGESTGPTEELRLDRPFVTDALAAAAMLHYFGARRVVLIGTCFGARTALAAASAVEQLAGVALFPPPVREFERNRQYATRPLGWYLRRMLSPRALSGVLNARRRRRYMTLLREKYAQVRLSPTAGAGSEPFQWVSDTFLEQLTSLVDRGVPVLIVYGNHDGFYQEWIEGQRGPVGELMRRAGNTVSVVVLDGKVHGLHHLETQDEVLGVIEDWLAKSEGLASATPAVRGQG